MRIYSDWLKPLPMLTTQQLRMINLPRTENQVIAGPAASGKTMLLLHRANALCKDHFTSAKGFRIFVSSKALEDHLFSALLNLRLPGFWMNTFDEWCVEYYQKHFSETLPWDDRGEEGRHARRPRFKEIRETILEALTSGTKPSPDFDFVMVDNGQELDRLSFQVLKRIACHVTVCHDYRQQFYAHGASELEMLECLGVANRSLTLSEVYCGAMGVARLASGLIEAPEERKSFLNQVRPLESGPPPVLVVAKDTKDETACLIHYLREFSFHHLQVAVLFPEAKHVYGYAEALKRAKSGVEAQDKPPWGPTQPILMTYATAKSMSFDIVLLPRLVQSGYQDIIWSKHRHHLFAAIMRATRFVYLSTVASYEIGPVLELEASALELNLTVYRRSPSEQPRLPPADSGERANRTG